MEGMHIRDAYHAPASRNAHFAPDPHSVCFLHPAISRAEGNILFILDGFDNVQGYLHHETARIACAIVAGNEWDGYLAKSPTGPAIDVPPHGLLEDNEYYFIVPRPQTPQNEHSHHVSATSPTEIYQPSQLNTSPYLYPVVPSFREWVFPTGRLPGTWQNLVKRRSPFVASISEAPRIRDQTCRMTEDVEETDMAHIVPLAEEFWFMSNNMTRYGNKHNTTRPGINDDANIMLLRADLHRSFDKRRFTFLPKQQGILVTHVFESESLRDLYHNVKLNQTYIAPEYLFARFAWTVLPLIKKFFLQWSNFDRLLLVQGKPQWASPYECLDFADPPKEKSESVSPKKPSSPRKGGSRKGSSTKSRNSAKRSRDERADEEAFARDDELELLEEDREPYQASPKRLRQTDAVFPSIGPAQQLQSPQHGPSLQDGGGAHWPAEPRTLPLAPNHSLQPLPIVHQNVFRNLNNLHESIREEETSYSDSECIGSPHPTKEPDEEHDWMPFRERLAMTTSHLRTERARSDIHRHWEKEEAWFDGLLRNGGALDSSEIERWRYVRGEDDAEYCAIPLDS